MKYYDIWSEGFRFCSYLTHHIPAMAISVSTSSRTHRALPLLPLTLIRMWDEPTCPICVVVRETAVFQQHSCFLMDRLTWNQLPLLAYIDKWPIQIIVSISSLHKDKLHRAKLLMFYYYSLNLPWYDNWGLHLIEHFLYKPISLSRPNLLSLQCELFLLILQFFDLLLFPTSTFLQKTKKRTVYIKCNNPMHEISCKFL